MRKGGNPPQQSSSALTAQAFRKKEKRNPRRSRAWSETTASATEWKNMEWWNQPHIQNGRRWREPPHQPILDQGNQGPEPAALDLDLEAIPGAPPPALPDPRKKTLRLTPGPPELHAIVEPLGRHPSEDSEAMRGVPPPKQRRITAQTPSGPSTFHGLIDPGCGPGILSRQVAEHLLEKGAGPSKVINPITLITAGGKGSTVKEELTLNIGGTWIAFLVADDLKEEALLGRKIIEILDLDGKGPPQEKEMRVQQATSYMLTLRKLEDHERKDSPGQTMTYELDWDCIRSQEDPPLHWNGSFLLNKLDKDRKVKLRQGNQHLRRKRILDRREDPQPGRVRHMLPGGSTGEKHKSKASHRL